MHYVIEKETYYDFNFAFPEAQRQISSTAACAPATAVAPVGSNGGETSTTSPPTILIPAKSRRMIAACDDDNPPQTGVPVPGAKAGSRQSISKLT